MLDGDFDSTQNVKKKKKRSFVQKQKRFAKQGHFGRGSQISSDLYEYFINITKVMNSKKDDDEEMSVLASNVYQEIEGKEAEYCCNQIVSRVVENLLPHSSDEDFAKFIEKFSDNLRPIFSDPFGSHVLQQTLIVSYLKYQKSLSEQEDDDKLHLQFYNYILKVSNFIFNNLEDFIWDMYSNAVTRTAFNVLSGNPVKGEVKPSSPEEEQDEGCGDKNIPTEFESLLKKFVKRILVWPQFKDLCNQTVNSNFLQSLLIATKKTDESLLMVEKIISFYESDPVDFTDEDNQPFVRLVEVMLSIVNEHTFKRIYKLMFKEKLCELAKSKSGNFAVQKLITYCNKEKNFRRIFSEIEGGMEEVLKVKHTAVLLALVKKCRILNIEGECMAMLTRIFDIKDPKEIFPLILSLTRREDFDFKSSPEITLHGALIVQELLNFTKPINMVNSILELSEAKLVQVLSDPKGSHIADAFVRSRFIGVKSRDKLFKKLQGHYLQLATSKHGSRALDAIWSVINIQNKVTLAEELKLKQSELSSDVYGRGFAKRIYLDNFRRNKDDWIKIHKSRESAKRHFSDIIPTKKQKTGDENLFEELIHFKHLNMMMNSNSSSHTLGISIKDSPMGLGMLVCCSTNS